MIADHRAASALSRMRSARLELTEVRKEAERRLAEASAFTDPNLSDEGLRAKRADMRSQVNAELSQYLDGYRSRVRSDAAAVSNHLTAERPKIGDDAASLMRSQAKWDQVRMRLESGMPMSKIIEGADTETALAIREWAPAWLDARNYAARAAGDTPPPVDSTGLLNSIDDRLVDLSPDTFRSAVAAARECEREWAGIEPMLDHVRMGAAGAPSESGLGAAIRSRYAEREAARRWTDPAADQADDNGHEQIAEAAH